ncbi:unnamed protein product [Kluyveromyces dobzhanskii CBS 2104]|uniref:WGS project CCBQ000000000 data, contig 00015 n=1 Tax=Kluyveromyces dobzhanskii CBS 2104 TaxID=1427455 RepID=A0A0A8L927_9SACH|nr:unnamed protein product [Kluyveromyces dobzhanskii CBS 2104]
MLSARFSVRQCCVRGLATQPNHVSQPSKPDGANTNKTKPAGEDGKVKRPRIQPFAALNTVRSNLSNDFDKNQPAQKIYSQFQSDLQKLTSEQRVNPKYFMNSSICNSVLTKLILQSNLELNGLNIGESATIPPTPFEILQTYLKYNLARHQHFVLVLKQFLVDLQPKEAINLWVSFLEHSKEMPLNSTGTSQIQALTSIGYLMLSRESNVKPDVKVLSQILSVSADKIPFHAIEQEIKSLGLKATSKDELLKSYDELLLQWFTADKTAFVDEFLKESNDTKLLGFLWKKYLALAVEDYTSTNQEIPGAFMIRLAQLGRSLDAVKIVGQLKEASTNFQPTVLLYNSLLQAVAHIPAFGKEAQSTRLDRIQAVWNSYIKKSNEPIGVDSYKAMLEALITAGHFKTVETFWTLDVPADVRNNSELSEIYLRNYFASVEKVPFSKLKSKIPNELQNLKLANTILLALAHSDASVGDIDAFYVRTFQSSTGIKPNNQTLAIKLLANMKTFDETNGTGILGTVGLSANSAIAALVIEEFLKICDNQEVATAFMKALRLDNSSKDSAKKFSNFLDYYLQHGNWEYAEKLFKEYLTANVKAPSQVNYKLFNSMFKGFSELSIAKNDTGFVTKQQVYWELCQKIHRRVFHECVISTLKSVSVLSRRNAEFSENELDFINNTVLPYLVKLKIENTFKLQNPRYLQNIKSNDKIHIPQELL